MSAVGRATRSTSGSGVARTSELWRGSVAEVFADQTAQVIVPHLGDDVEPIGRIPSLVPNLAVGARVIVGAIEGRVDDLVVLAALSADGVVVGDGRFTYVLLDNEPTDPHHAVSKSYADALGDITATVNTIVRRGATGSIIVQDCYLGGVQSAGNAATTKTYVDGETAKRYEKTLVVLPTTAHDLNSYSSGFYHQAANAGATTGTNYPVALAGLLEAFTSASMVYQRYTTYNSGTTYTRSKYSTTWYPWKEHSVVGHTHAYSSLTGIPATFAPSAHTHPMTELTGVLDPAQLPAATSSAAGSMSAADKAKLDAATDVNTNDTIVKRSTGGWINSYGVNVSMPAPTLGSHLTRKDYVDQQVATRAASTHTHTYADISGTVPTSALPPLAVNDVFTVASQTAMLALTAQRGDMAIRTDTGKSYALSTDSPGTLADWKELMAAGQVVSVAGKTGVVTLAKGDVGLGNVDNTSDAAKPVSAAQQTALNGKANSVHTHAIADITNLQSTLDAKALASDIEAYVITLPAATALPNAYPTGISVGQVATEADWPATYSTVTTYRYGGSRSYQELVKKITGERWWRAEGDNNTWGAWAQVATALEAGVGPWVALTLLNGWVAYSGGGNYYSGLRVRRHGKSIQVQGMIKNGAAGSIVANFPSDLIPTDSAIHIVAAGTAATPRQVAYFITGVQTRGSAATLTYDSGPAAPTFVSIDFLTPIYEAP
ncbi:minor tail protein [Arthrobacter phage Wyborn]|uniref:Minor tail protein n=1 Tax=Arthrobacter phage Wyborn TaxID=3059067 RepID=A0AA96K815_9CAUD|nr:minor tail protein [Arthrobacter phage Wyborn]